MPGIKNPAIRERNSQRIFGCSVAEAEALNSGLNLRDPRGWAMKYCHQRQASKERGISWEITFPEWMGIWSESGLMDQRGRGRLGFCMARHGDEGPYRLGNVSIKSNLENSSEGLKKTHRLGIFKAPRTVRRRTLNARGWTKRRSGPRPYQVMCGEKYVGCFATEEEARAAYLSAREFHSSPSV